MGFGTSDVLLQTLQTLEATVAFFAVVIGAVAGRVLDVSLQALLRFEGALLAEFASEGHGGVSAFALQTVLSKTKLRPTRCRPRLHSSRLVRSRDFDVVVREEWWLIGPF